MKRYLVIAAVAIMGIALFFALAYAIYLMDTGPVLEPLLMSIFGGIYGIALGIVLMYVWAWQDPLRKEVAVRPGYEFE